jgi:hypothetical protein
MFVIFIGNWLIVSDFFTTVLKNFKNKFTNLNLNQGSHLFFPSLRQHFKSQKQDVLSLGKEPVSKVVLRQTYQVVAEFLDLKLLISPFSF